MFWFFFGETQVRLAQILRTILMLRMQEMAFPDFKFQKFSGGECPRTPLLEVAFDHSATFGFYSWIRQADCPDLVGFHCPLFEVLSQLWLVIFVLSKNKVLSQLC